VPVIVYSVSPVQEPSTRVSECCAGIGMQAVVGEDSLVSGVVDVVVHGAGDGKDEVNVSFRVTPCHTARSASRRRCDTVGC